MYEPSTQSIDISNRDDLRRWAHDLGASPHIVKIAVKRVGTSPALVREYLAGEPNRWQPELYSKSRHHAARLDTHATESTPSRRTRRCEKSEP